MTDQDTSVLTRAAVLSGGVPGLSRRLNVSPEDLLAWIANPATAPADVLASATAIVNAYEIDRTGTVLLKVAALKKPRPR